MRNSKKKEKRNEGIPFYRKKIEYINMFPQ